MLFGWHFESFLPHYLHLPTYPLLDGLVIYALSVLLSHSVLLHALLSRLARLLRSPITLLIPDKHSFDVTLAQVRFLVTLAAVLTRSHLLLCLNLLIFDQMPFSKCPDRVAFRVKVAWVIGLNADKIVVDLWRYTDFLLNFQEQGVWPLGRQLIFDDYFSWQERYWSFLVYGFYLMVANAR